MSQAAHDSSWSQMSRLLAETFPEGSPTVSDHTVIIPLADEDWLLEVTSEGFLICQAGYELEDLKSLLSDGTAEDLGNDELAKQAKFYLQQVVAKYRQRLHQEGFAERTEMHDEYVAVYFERTVDLTNPEAVLDSIRHCRSLFSTPR